MSTYIHIPFPLILLFHSRCCQLCRKISWSNLFKEMQSVHLLLVFFNQSWENFSVSTIESGSGQHSPFLWFSKKALIQIKFGRLLLWPSALWTVSIKFVTHFCPWSLNPACLKYFHLNLKMRRKFFEIPARGSSWCAAIPVGAGQVRFPNCILYTTKVEVGEPD